MVKFIDKELEISSDQSDKEVSGTEVLDEENGVD